jgi:pyrroline-5-carboxylate reductase
MTIPLRGTLVLLGAGKMGGAMLEGWLKAGISPQQIVALDPSPPVEVRAAIEASGVRLNPDLQSVQNIEVLLVAVKPQIMDDVLANASGLGKSNPLVVSVVAGKTIAAFEKHFGSAASIIRTIPNTPSAIGRGITAIFPNSNVSPAQLGLAEKLLSAIGDVVKVEQESHIDAATAVSGSGPAYIFYLTECLAAAGQALGLAPELATQLARATVSGSGELMRQSGIDAETLRKNVTSPNGTTHAALQILMAEPGLKELMTKAVAAAEKRARELAS